MNQHKIDIATKFSEDKVKRLKKRIEKLDTDADQKERLNQCECKTCFYLEAGIALQAFTTYICKCCEDKYSYPNSNVPKYCTSCSYKYNICRRCGASKGE